MIKKEAVAKLTKLSGIKPDFIEIKGRIQCKYLTLHMFINHKWVNLYPVLYFTNTEEILSRFKHDGLKRIAHFKKGVTNVYKSNRPAPIFS